MVYFFVHNEKAKDLLCHDKSGFRSTKQPIWVSLSAHLETDVVLVVPRIRPLS